MAKRAGKVRIIGGDLRGTMIPVEDRAGLRPTGDRVKENLFNWLAFYIEGANCLDLFAGTGALGLECISRGSGAVTFVEKDQLLANNIISLVSKLELSTTEVLVQDSLSYIKGCGVQFDLVFIDPPFKSDLLLSTLEQVGQNNLVSNGLVYVEFSRDELVLPKEWRHLKKGFTKGVEYCLLTKR